MDAALLALEANVAENALHLALVVRHNVAPQLDDDRFEVVIDIVAFREATEERPLAQSLRKARLVDLSYRLADGAPVLAPAVGVLLLIRHLRHLTRPVEIFGLKRFIDSFYVACALCGRCLGSFLLDGFQLDYEHFAHGLLLALFIVQHVFDDSANLVSHRLLILGGVDLLQ